MPTVEQVRGALKEVMDPEYPISVLDLGLIRGIEVDGSTVRVLLTFTSLGCPCADIIQDDIRQRILQIEGVEEVRIEQVFAQWSRADISQEGLQRLRKMGVI